METAVRYFHAQWCVFAAHVGYI